MIFFCSNQTTSSPKALTLNRDGKLPVRRNIGYVFVANNLLLRDCVQSSSKFASIPTSKFKLNWPLCAYPETTLGNYSFRRLKRCYTITKEPSVTSMRFYSVEDKYGYKTNKPSLSEMYAKFEPIKNTKFHSTENLPKSFEPGTAKFTQLTSIIHEITSK